MLLFSASQKPHPKYRERKSPLTRDCPTLTARRTNRVQINEMEVTLATCHMPSQAVKERGVAEREVAEAVGCGHEHLDVAEAALGRCLAVVHRDG